MLVVCSKLQCNWIIDTAAPNRKNGPIEQLTLQIQRVVIECLVAEKLNVVNIHNRLCVVCGRCAVDMSTVVAELRTAKSAAHWTSRHSNLARHAGPS